MSHELRTPLTPILAWVSQLRRRALDPARTARALEVIDRSARAQARLVDDLLEVSRMIGGKLHLDVRPMRLAAAIEAAIEAMRPAASAKNIRVETRLDPGPDRPGSGRSAGCSRWCGICSPTRSSSPPRAGASTSCSSAWTPTSS